MEWRSAKIVMALMLYFFRRPSLLGPEWDKVGRNKGYWCFSPNGMEILQVSELESKKGN